MRVRPWVMTAAGTAIACAALGVVMSASEPSTAGAAHLTVVWAALFLVVWGVAATVMLWFRMNLSQAVWCALVMAAGIGAAFATRRWGSVSPQLLASVGLATLSLSFFAWYRLRHG